MRKRIAFIAAAAASAYVLGVSGPALASCDQGVPTSGHNDVAVVPGTGSHVYNDGGAPGGTSAYAGVHGGTGYIEAGADATGPSVVLQGSRPDGSVDAKLYGDGSGPRLCVNDTVIL